MSSRERTWPFLPLGEGFVHHPLLGLVEPPGLELEHRPVAAAERHQLVVRAQLDDAAALQHADAVGVAYGREPVRDEERRRAAGCRQDAPGALSPAPYG